jgi:hypothetical protein
VGESALLVERPHVLETPARRLAAGRVVLWIQGGREYRLESELPTDRMLELARAVSAALAT